jgi:uncharacterized protein YqeY
MSIDKVNQDLNSALRNGDQATVDALRLLKSALINARIALGHELNEEEFVKVVKKEMKSRVEARDLFANNDRPEQASKEEFERNTYAIYAPADMSAEQIDKIITETAKNLEPGYNFSQLMPAVMKQVSGQADGKLVSDLIKKHLESIN